MISRVLGPGVIGFLAAGSLAVAATVHLAEPEPVGLQMAGFEIAVDAEVEVDAAGLPDFGSGPRIGLPFISSDEDRRDRWPVHAWILNSTTREPVWVISRENASRHGDESWRARTTVSLPAGRYEVYLFSSLPRFTGTPGEDDEPRREPSWIERVFMGTQSSEEARDALDECYVSVNVSGATAKRFEPTGDLPGALIRLNNVGDSELVAAGFALTQPSTLRLRGFVERARGGRSMADFGWIVNHDTREVVWMPHDLERGSGIAGDEGKNRVVDEEVRLEPGRYLLQYGTDNSHSFPDFNAAPPFDPLNWGVTLLPGSDFDATTFSTFDPTLPDPWIDLTGIGNDELRSQAFRMQKDGALHILAQGELGSENDLADQGWILDAATRETVWQMTVENTIDGGGSLKNRSFDGIVQLPRGEYVLHYATDDSHAWESWNDAAPFRAREWGVSIRPTGDTSLSDVELIDEDDLTAPEDVLVRLTGVGNDQRQGRAFRLDERSRLSIYALGEGTDGDMYDYGYIVESDGGRTVWEMTYDRTEHAGGHRKNRSIRDEVELDSGEYRALYVSDDSHSFQQWNVARPHDSMNWGITVRKLD